MTPEEMKALQPGDLVRHPFLEHAYVITGNYGTHVTAVRQVLITNPQEWEIVPRPRKRAEKKS